MNERTPRYLPPFYALFCFWLGCALVAFGSNEATSGAWAPTIDTIAVYAHGFCTAILCFFDRLKGGQP